MAGRNQFHFSHIAILRFSQGACQEKERQFPAALLHTAKDY